MITAVILNWKRTKNVSRILSDLKEGGLVKECIVWNNNPQMNLTHPWAKIINSSCDMGLYTRFAAASLARNDCILIQDDDLNIPTDELQKLYTAWEKNPHVLHGVFGRVPIGGKYSHKNHTGPKQVPIVLTRVLLTHRHYVSCFLNSISDFSPVQTRSKPFGNGEDIIFSYVVCSISKRLNQIHKIRVQELSNENAMNRRDWKGHIAHRSNVVRFCEKWLKEQTV